MPILNPINLVPTYTQSKQDILIHCLSLDRRGPEINNGSSAQWALLVSPGAAHQLVAAVRSG